MAPRAINSDVIEIKAPTRAEAQRLYDETIGEATTVKAKRITIEATGETATPRKLTRRKPTRIA